MAIRMSDGSMGQRSRFPEIVLDTTLAELLTEEPEWRGKQSLCNMKPCADPRHETVPLNKKYLITSTQASDGNDLAHLQLENVSYLLSFWAGHMEVALMACEGWSNDDTLTQETINENAKRGFSILNERQRPWPMTFSNKDHFVDFYEHNTTQTRWAFAVDFAERVPCFIHPEKQYLLNSKRWLGVCPLRSANDKIIDPECSCTEHRTQGGRWFYVPDCDECKKNVKEELSRLEKLLQNTKLPFVLKLTQSLGSVGTMLVKNEKDREKAIKHIVEVQKEFLTYVTAENAHIYPASLVISDFLPGNTNALNFYIRRDGGIRLIGACHQLSTRLTEGGKQNTALTWSQQTKLEKKFHNTLAEIGMVLHDQGYFGPCGADIMETEDGTQYVIDLNVRTTTSTVLGCLGGHCEKRKFDVCAVYECLLLSLSRDDLETKFEREFEEGRLILLGNTRLGKKDIWAYPVVLCGEDDDAVKRLGKGILEFEAKTDSATQDAGGA